MSTPTVRPYQPFPGFKEFARAHFDSTTYEQFAGLLEQAKAEADQSRLAAAVQKATKWAAIDTGAIEGLYDVDRGFTFSVAAEAAAWDNIHLELGADAEESIKDALHGYDYVIDVATGNRPISEAWVKELHAVICASQDTYKVVTANGAQSHNLPKGTYKKHPNSPYNIASSTVHSYAPVTDTPAEMHRLMEELRSADFQNAHPVMQAAYAHYAFVCIHPFADGNGRVSRALASVYLYRSPGVPLVIFADQKPAYIAALEAADGSDYSPFVEFIGERAVDVVRMVADDMKRSPLASARERLAALQKSLVGKGGLPHEEVDALASLLFDEFSAAIKRALQAHAVEPPLSTGSQVITSTLTHHLEGFRNPPQSRILQVNCKSAAPASAAVAKQYGALISLPSNTEMDFAILGSSDEIVCEALLRDIHPSVSPALTYRLDTAAEAEVLQLIDRTATAAEEALRKAGYLSRE